jgi:hypothetical protein
VVVRGGYVVVQVWLGGGPTMVWKWLDCGPRLLGGGFEWFGNGLRMTLC